MVAVGQSRFAKACLVLLKEMRIFYWVVRGNSLRTPNKCQFPPSEIEFDAGRRQKSDCPPRAARVMLLLANMPTEARANLTVEMASINLKGWQQSRWLGRESQEGRLLFPL